MCISVTERERGGGEGGREGGREGGLPQVYTVNQCTILEEVSETKSSACLCTGLESFFKAAAVPTKSPHQGGSSDNFKSLARCGVKDKLLTHASTKYRNYLTTSGGKCLNY